VITFATFRFLTAAVRIGPADGPTSAADGPMNPTNRNAEPTQSTPARMWNDPKTINDIESRRSDMASIESRSFDEPDETRTPDKTTIEVVGLANGQIQRSTFEPGWRWSESIGPIAGTDRCQVEHIGYAVAGQLHVEHDDGTVTEIRAGDVFRVAPGHDGRVVGDEPVVWIEFQGAAHPAER
jgi:hypothetical protein